MKSFAQYSVELGIGDSISDSVWYDLTCESVSVIDLYVPLTERKIFKKDFRQPWMDQVKPGMSPSEVYNVAHDYVKSTRAKETFDRILKRTAAGKNPKIMTDVKTHDSFIDKSFLRKKGYNLDDVLRGAILVADEKALNETIKNIYKNFDVFEHDVKERETGLDKDADYGYFGSHHFAVQIEGTGVVCELQVMTRKLWAYKHEGHKIYVKTRSKGASNMSDEVRAREMERSREIFKLGNR